MESHLNHKHANYRSSLADVRPVSGQREMALGPLPVSDKRAKWGCRTQLRFSSSNGRNLWVHPELVYVTLVGRCASRQSLGGMPTQFRKALPKRVGIFEAQQVGCLV
jgi:hypothetical protein